MSLLDLFGIDTVETAIRLLLKHSPKHKRWALRVWHARANPLKLGCLIAELRAAEEGIDVPPGSPADQVIGVLVAHAYKPHVRAALTRAHQRPPTDAEVREGLAGVRGLVEGILPRCE